MLLVRFPSIPHISFSKDYSSVTLSFVPEFRAKNQSFNEFNRPFSIPSLKSILGPDDKDIPLCPARALRYYLDRTKGHRQGKRRLFLSFDKNYDKNIQKGTIARWIRTLVHCACAQCASSLTPSTVKAHETRAIASSLAAEHRWTTS